MGDILNIFNPRECALLTLGIAGLVAVLFVKDMRRSMWKIVVIFFSQKYFRIYAMLILYVAGLVYGLFLLGLWDVSLLKDTVKWFLFAATVTFTKIRKFQEGNDAYRKTFRDIFTGSTLLEFFTDKFSFGYVAELVLIPLATILAVVKDKSIMLRRCLMLLGFCFLAHLVYSAVTHPAEWFNLQGLKEFALAPALSVLLLPFIFSLALYLTYTTQFAILARKLPDAGLINYAKRKALFAFGTDQQSLMRWQTRMQFQQIDSGEKLIATIADLKMTLVKEKKRPLVSYGDGWSPYLAKDFLNPVFKTKYYEPVYQDNWVCDSNLVYPNGKKYSNNYFHYEVLGYEDTATALELQLNVMAPLDTTDLVSPTLAYAFLLYKNAMGDELPEKLQNAIINGKSCKLNIGLTKIRLTKEVWPKTVNDCYGITLAFYRGKAVKF